MATDACIENINGRVVNAKKLTLEQTKQKFYCRTPDCCAQMCLVSRMTERAHFRSYHISEHISSKCILDSLNFNSSKYSEEAFSLVNAIKYIIGSKNSYNIHKQNISYPHSLNKSTTVGGDQKMPISTLKQLYAQCLETE